ncbi:MAG: YhjD/YihY/BrkB family envelope integrity protein [Methylotenera sp.]|nr:YhjD/YihY/BrkB family envelope integrity protein [Methylotenera sp.]
MKKLTFKARPKTARQANLPRIPTSLQSAINKPREAYAKQRYNTPLFVLHEMFKAFGRHNALGLSASLSFYAMFALIPLVLLMFFVLSHLVFSSDYAVVKLAIITGNLVPKFSSTIMLEVYNSAQQKAAWGALGLFILLWSVTPLASAMRSTFYNIAALVEAPSYVRRKIKDILAVMGMLILFFLFTFAGLMLEKVIAFLSANSQLMRSIIETSGSLTTIVSLLVSLTFTTLVIAAFYFVFFPVRLYIKHIFIGALFTAILWLLMRPAFTLFLTINESYGSVFGSMKNLFISITWLYFNFAVFLLGTELIATLRKKDVLLLKGLFNGMPQTDSIYQQQLMQRFGKTYHQGEHIFNHGESTHYLFYVVSGQVQLTQDGKVIRAIEAGDYFGEMAMLSNLPTIADAVVASETANVVVIHPDTIEILLLDEPKVAMKFLRQMATRLQMRDA